MSRDGNPWAQPAPGRHRAPVTPKRPLELQIRKRHLAVVVAAMVAMAWLPAELADTVVPHLLAPPAAVAAEEPAPPNPTGVIQPVATGVVQPARTAAESLPAVLPSVGSTATPEPAQTVSGLVTATPVAAPPVAPVVTTTAPSAPPAPPSTQPATQPAAQPPVHTTPTPRPEPSRAWPPNCGAQP